MYRKKFTNRVFFQNATAAIGPKYVRAGPSIFPCVLHQTHFTDETAAQR